MNKLESITAALVDIDLEQVTGGAQEDYFTYQREQSALTYQRAANGGQNVGFEYGGLTVAKAK